ncbi:hypothetical protein [uncultured Desulfosarcina sp.]|uniref:hypothetical protein n=1 Tax=uncultured Desulfosarcina sp. TaxID=218289 RepID=UPI0029C64F04|nr:hypothetical protein [uncultured Desulfosarcina sp.]
MKKALTIFFVMLMAGLAGCSVQPSGGQDGIAVVFDGAPQLFDPSVVFMGTVVGQTLSSESKNGVTRVAFALDNSFDELMTSNLVAVARNGRLHLDTLGGYGEPLSPGASIVGFVKPSSYQWFKFKNIINNATMSAQHRAQRLQAQYGMGG